MVRDEATVSVESNLKEFVVSREFRVLATNEAEAKLVLEQQLIDMSEAAIAVKQIAAEMHALQVQALCARADAVNAAELPPLEKRGAKDHGPN